jgi:hypothetical protein
VLVSGLLLIHQLNADAVPWMVEAARIFDELVIFIDEQRALPGVHERARETGARVCSSYAPTLYRSDFRQMMASCAGEWVVRIDGDEQLSPEWREDGWRDILSTTDLSHFWCPRRWLTSRGCYLHAEPWWPDYQLRVFRNRPSEITCPTSWHDTGAVAGNGGHFRSLAIHHHDLWLTTREVREAKVETYRRDRPDHDLSYFYQFEDFDIKPVPLPADSAFDLKTELLSMPALSPSQGRGIRLEVSTCPSKVSHAPFWLEVVVINNSAHTLCSGGPLPLYVSYHWLGQNRQTVVHDGRRSAILPEIFPGRSARINAFILPPVESGEYLLRMTIVQEKLRWLEDADPSIAHELAVTVH